MRKLYALIAGLTLFAAACGGGGEESTDVVLRAADDFTVDVETLPEVSEDDVEETSTGDDTSDAQITADEDDGSGDETEEETPTEDTLPQNEDDTPAVLTLLDAMGEFNACLDAEGRQFIGAPNPEAGPDDPVNDPAYLAVLSTCAARSRILEAVAAAQTESSNLTPEEIETRNEGFLLWRECMIGRGWLVPEPVPDELGLLGLGAAAAGEFVAPEGETLVGSDDLRECANQSIEELTEQNAAEESGE